MGRTPTPPLHLLDLAAGYQRSRTLAVAVEFGRPALLSPAPLTVGVIVNALQLHPRAAEAFLNACVALGLAEHRGHRYRNSALAELYLVRGKPTYLGDEITRLDQTSYARWMNLADDLRAWRPGATDGGVPQADDQGAGAMMGRHNLSLLVGRALSYSYDFSSHAHMLDLGGGTAAMSLSTCETHPAIRSTVFELPHVARLARGFIEAGGFTSRIAVVEGNFKSDGLPEGFDLALLSNLLSVASEETNRRLFRSIYDRLPAGGAIALTGYIIGGDCSSPIPPLFSLQDITWQTPDVERDVTTYKCWLGDAGFVGVEGSAFFPPTSMIVGRKEARP